VKVAESEYRDLNLKEDTEAHVSVLSLHRCLVIYQTNPAYFIALAVHVQRLGQQSNAKNLDIKNLNSMLVCFTASPAATVMVTVLVC
jgi:hypothetical protein